MGRCGEASAPRRRCRARPSPEARRAPRAPLRAPLPAAPVRKRSGERALIKRCSNINTSPPVPLGACCWGMRTARAPSADMVEAICV